MVTCRRQFEDARQSLQEGLPSIRYTVASSSSSTHHYYRHQVIELARRHGYWADLREQRRWTLLKLEDGGIVDIVVTLHSIGNPSTGAAVANIFMDHRDAGEEMSVETQVLLPVEPLRLVPDEIEEKQATKFDEWLATALRHALAQWTRYL